MKTGLIIGSLLVLCIIVLLIMYWRRNTLKSKKMGSRVDQYGFIHNALLTQMPLPYAVLEQDGKILWANNRFIELFEKENPKEHYLSSYIHDLNRGIFPKEEGQSSEVDVSYEGHDYRATLMYVSLKNLYALEGSLGFAKDREAVVTVTLEDVTELHRYMKENEAQKYLSFSIFFTSPSNGVRY